MKDLLFPKGNLIFAIYLTSLPLLVSLFALIGFPLNILQQLLIWGITYIIFLNICFLKNFNNTTVTLKNIKLNKIQIIALLILIWLILTTIINNSFNLYFFLYIEFYLIFICLYNLKRKYVIIVINCLLSVMAICCIMSFIDPWGHFMPGFSLTNRAMALQYIHPNYSATIMASITIISFLFASKTTIKKLSRIFYIITYLIFSIFLFMNASYVSIAALILMEFIITLFLWIKHKKIPTMLVILLLTLIPICFLIDYVPLINSIRTCHFNFFLETVAVFDNIFGTDLLSLFNIEVIPGADGWDRNTLMLNALKFSTSSVRNFLFGCGPGGVFTHRPHNMLLSLLVEFGILMPILFVTFYVFVFIYACKNRSRNVFHYSMILISFLVANISGSLLHYSYYISIIYLAVLLKYIFINKDNKNKQAKIQGNEKPTNTSKDKKTNIHNKSTETESVLEN